MTQTGFQAGAMHPTTCGAASRVSGQRTYRPRYFAAFLLLLGAPFNHTLAEEIPTASANVQEIAIADALRYAQSPQLDLHQGRNTQPNAKSTSIVTMTRKLAQMAVHAMWDSMQRDAESNAANRSSSKQFSTSYDLRLSDDRILLRMRRRF